MDPDQLEEVTAKAEISKTPPGLMSGPAWRARPSCVVSDVLEKGLEVPQLGPMQAMSLQTGPENEHLQPWKFLHRLSHVY